MSYLITAYVDLLGMKEIMKISNPNFNSVHVYPTFRDICLFLYQINKDILNGSIELDDDITIIRHRIHLHKNKNNYEIYRKILEISISMFGNDIDNLGFYFNGSKLVGSTIYPCYIFMDTIFSSKSAEELGKNTFEFAKLVGESMANIFQSVKLLIPKDITRQLSFKFNQRLSTNNYELKDIYHRNLFTEIKNQNTVITRLILCLQEASTSVWLFKTLYKESKTLTIENYILLRLISIKADEIHDNLINIRKYINEIYKLYNKQSNKRLSQLIDSFDEKYSNEVQILRNMIHYDKNGVNFLDYLINKQLKNPHYMREILTNLVNDYLVPLNNLISDLFEIEKIESMTDFKKILNRFSSLNKGKNIYKL